MNINDKIIIVIHINLNKSDILTTELNCMPVNIVEKLSLFLFKYFRQSYKTKLINKQTNNKIFILRHHTHLSWNDKSLTMAHYSYELDVLCCWILNYKVYTQNIIIQ